MGLNILTLGSSKTYTDESLIGLGSLKGAPCTIKSITEVDGGQRVIFEWTGTSGTTQTSTIKVMDGLSITGIDVNSDNTLTCKLSDGSTITTENSIKTIKGFSPTIVENSSNTDEIYKLDITDENGTTTTPNLKGDRGSDGHTPIFTIGTVTTLPSGSEATLSITGTSENPVLNIGIPKGVDGDDALITTDEKVKMTSTDTDAKYLEEFFDNATIELDTENNVLYASKIKDQTVSVAEINFLTGVTSNIQEQINNLSKSMSMYGVFDTKADLLACETLPVDGNTAIVVADETLSSKQMTYIYIEASSEWKAVAESTVTIRDFTLNPINLVTETTGILPKEKIDNAIARLSQVLDKETYASSTDGVVNSSKTLDGLLYTIAEINNAIGISHEHLNITALNKIIINGIGNRFLSDNGIYKELIIKSSSTPTDEYVFWLDTSDVSNPILKIFDGTDWIAVSSSSSSSEGGYTTVDAAMSDTSTNPVQNKVIKKYVDSKSIDISSETNNAISEKSDGIYVEDKTSAINEVNNKVDNIKKYQKYVNTELDYCSLVISKTFAGATVTKGDVVPFDTVENDNNMEYDSTNYSVLLKYGKTYKIDCDVYVNGTGNMNYDIVDITHNVILRRGVKTPSSSDSNNSNSNTECIYTPNEDCYVQIQISYVESNNTFASSTISLSSYFIIEEINRAITIDALEHVNESSGIEDTPVGHIIPFMGNNAPAHYLICNGTEYNIADYSHLAQHFIDEFGSVNYFGGDGTTTFAVPDLRGEFLRGTGSKYGNGSAVGNHQDGTFIPRLQLWANGESFDVYGETGVLNQTKNYDMVTNSTIGSYSSTTMTIGDEKERTIGGTIRPTNTSVLYCIKYEPTYYMNYTSNLTGFDTTVLWEGSAISTGNYSLTDSIYNYDFIMFLVEWNNHNQRVPYLYHTSMIDSSRYDNHITLSFSSTINDISSIEINFYTSPDIMTINSIYMSDETRKNSYFTYGLTKVIGVKGLPSYDYSTLSDEQVIALKTRLGING